MGKIIAGQEARKVVDMGSFTLPQGVVSVRKESPVSGKKDDASGKKQGSGKQR